MPVTPLFTADQYTYRLLWDENRARYLGVCSEFPDLTYEATSTGDALAGIQHRVAAELDDLVQRRAGVPEPLARRQFNL